jgi:hypothetical protein
MASSWRKIPFLRWSFWRLVFGMKHLTMQWQVGDGREARLRVRATGTPLTSSIGV